MFSLLDHGQEVAKFGSVCNFLQDVTFFFFLSLTAVKVHLKKGINGTSLIKLIMTNGRECVSRITPHFEAVAIHSRLSLWNPAP